MPVDEKPPAMPGDIYFVVFYSIYGIKKIYFKFFWNFFEKSLDFINILW